jgi:MFS family permease
VYALFAFPAGIVADKVGLKKIFIIGLALFATKVDPFVKTIFDHS